MKVGIVACSDPLSPGFAPKFTLLCEKLRQLHTEAMPEQPESVLIIDLQKSSKKR